MVTKSTVAGFVGTGLKRNWSSFSTQPPANIYIKRGETDR
jgi:hypothetical protein